MADLDPTLTPVNCAGSTCSVILGRDPSAGDSQGPTALRGVVNHDDTLICDVNGLMVNRCQPPPDLDVAYLPADVDSGNTIRKSTDCGLIVLAPFVKNEGGGNEVDISSTPGDTSANSKTFSYTNNDTVDHLVTLKAVARTACEKTNADSVSCLLRVALQATSNITALGGTTGDRSLTVTLTFDDGSSQSLSDRRIMHDMFVVPPSATLTVNYRAQTTNHTGVDTSSSGNGFEITSLVSRIEQVRTS